MWPVGHVAAFVLGNVPVARSRPGEAVRLDCVSKSVAAMGP